MNAYELADLNDWACCANSKEVSAMIRQQADRIVELEKDLEVTTRERNDCIRVQVEGLGVEKQSEPIGTVDELFDEFIIREQGWDRSLKLYTTPQTKPLSEPVAWMYGNTVSTNMITGGIPLYTTPQTKPSPDGLTDPKSYYQGYEDGVQSLTVTDPRPVAFMKDFGGFTDDPVLATQDGFNFPMYVTKADYQKIKQKKPYDAPQTKPLSDEEIEEIWTEITCQEFNVPYSFARAIEAKVRGEK